ncbi:phospholipase D-like domain-containing protein [Nocardioides cynanchi]|uniref:phospholipase D-like domain-containing protein n=1 Tax=Nocardioides cynanchi TaxID=2558918 RepID=UPI001785C387|nr:phospholipase D-like domain-containing protein [Nocardioides cynanchi]
MAVVLAGGLTVPTHADTTKSSVTAAAAKPKPKPKWKPAEGAFFNTPRAGSKEWVLHRQIVAAIEHAKPTSFIRIALFSFDRKYVASKLIQAHARGVHVQVLLNDHQVTPAQRMLHKALGTNRFKKSFAYECSHGCRSHGENLHTKFYLFSHTGAAHQTVMTGSVNLTGNSAINQYNDLWVRNDTRGLTKAFRLLFKQMRRDKPAHPAFLVQNIGKDYKLEATPYPNGGPHHDPIIKILDNVHCLNAAPGTGNAVHHTVVRVVMHAWNDPRGTYLARKIRALYAAGCDVKLMYGISGASVRAVFKNSTQRGYIPVHTTGYDTNLDGFIDLYTHQKELLISGNFGKNRGTKMVVTGSSNWNIDGLRGDEEIFEMRRARAYAQYINDFDSMWAKHSKLVAYIPYPNRPPSPPPPTTTTVRPGARVLVPTEPESTVTAEPKAGGPAWEND